jgi:hypothetical protein
MFIGKYVVHELANFFPMLKGEQYEQLYEDIKEHGLQEPIVLFEGKILDGRNRALIAHKLGLKIKFKDFEDLKTGKSALQYVISANLHRRHLSDEERVEIGANLAKALMQQNADKEEVAEQKPADIPVPKHLAQPNNSGNRRPLSEQGGRGNKGPAAIAAAAVGASKRAINEELTEREKVREALNNLSSDMREKVISASLKRDGSPGNTKTRKRALKEVAGIDLHPDKPKPRLAAHGGSEPMDPDRALRRLCNVAYAALDRDNYTAVKGALETDAWKLSEPFLVGLATLKDSQILKVIDCLRFPTGQDPEDLDLRFEPQ